MAPSPTQSTACGAGGHRQRASSRCWAPATRSDRLPGVEPPSCWLRQFTPPLLAPPAACPSCASASGCASASVAPRSHTCRVQGGDGVRDGRRLCCGRSSRLLPVPHPRSTSSGTSPLQRASSPSRASAMRQPAAWSASVSSKSSTLVSWLPAHPASATTRDPTPWACALTSWPLQNDTARQDTAHWLPLRCLDTALQREGWSVSVPSVGTAARVEHAPCAPHVSCGCACSPGSAGGGSAGGPGGQSQSERCEQEPAQEAVQQVRCRRGASRHSDPVFEEAQGAAERGGHASMRACTAGLLRRAGAPFGGHVTSAHRAPCIHSSHRVARACAGVVIRCPALLHAQTTHPLGMGAPCPHALTPPFAGCFAGWASPQRPPPSPPPRRLPWREKARPGPPGTG